jgi:hypothetical protein
MPASVVSQLWMQQSSSDSLIAQMISSISWGHWETKGAIQQKRQETVSMKTGLALAKGIIYCSRSQSGITFRAAFALTRRKKHTSRRAQWISRLRKWSSLIQKFILHSHHRWLETMMMLNGSNRNGETLKELWVTDIEVKEDKSLFPIRLKV